MLELEGVRAAYGQFPCIHGISMNIAAGEAVAVIGANGAGKTSLLRVISGMLPATAGRMTMDGTDLRAIAPHRIIDTGIAHVPENRRLFPRLTVEENLRMGSFPRAARGHFKERLDYVYDLFPKMKERRSQAAGTMSGGEQQMCAIARALMSKPRLILLDEPSTGLAPVVVQQVFEFVRRISAEGYTVLIVEQNVKQVLKVTDRACLIEKGQIEAAGTSAEMMASDSVRQSYMGVAR